MAKWRLNQLRRKNIYEKESEKQPEVSGIFVYPVKSLQGISVESHSYNSYGLKYDRYVMIVKPNPTPFIGPATHSFVTQRQVPSLAQINCSLPGDMDEKIVLSYKRNNTKESLTIDISKEALLKCSEEHYYKARVWSDTIEVIDLGEEAATFIRKFINLDEYEFVRLVAFPPNSNRFVNSSFIPFSAYYPDGKIPKLAFADGYPILVACESSLQELNKRLKSKGKSPIDMSNFRPNLVIRNTQPFEEDSWKIIQIGTNTIAHIVKGCTRCKQSCTNQKTGEVSEEPLETLAEFRSLGQNKLDVYFAQNAIVQNFGNVIELSKITNKKHIVNDSILNVGDKITVLKRGNPVWDEGPGDIYH